MANINDAFGVEDAIEFENTDVFLITTTTNPSTGGGQEAPVGSVVIDSSSKSIFVKDNTGDTDWVAVASATSPIGTMFVSSADTTAGFLNSKISVTAPLQKSITSPGGNEVLNLSLIADATLPGTGGVTIPKGTTAERPISPSTGQQRFNTTTGVNEYWNGTEWVVNANQDAFTASLATTGFADRTQSVITSDYSTRTVTISPVGASYDVYVAGQKYTKTGPESVILDNVYGYHIVSFDVNGQLRSDIGSIPVFDQTAPVVAAVYTPLSPVIGIAEARYGLSMDWATRSNLYFNQGMQWVSGLDLTGYTTSGTGSLDTDAQISFTDGRIAIQDIDIDILNGPYGTDFTLPLNGPAEISITYKSGSGFNYIAAAPTTFPVMFGTNTIVYNKDTAGTWSVEDVTDGYYIAMWVTATAVGTLPITLSMGIRQDPTLSEAITNNKLSDIVPSNQQFTARPLYCLYFQADSNFSNTIKARLVGFTDYRGVNITLPIVSHSILNDLDRDDHLQYVHTSINRTITAQHAFDPIAAQPPFVLGSMAQGELVSGFNADLLDGHDASYFQPMDTDLTALANISGSGSGLYAVTGVGTSAVRTLTGTTDQISISNGSGVSGNPTISISSNPVLSGNGSLTLPNGTSGQRPGAPSSGMIRYNSTLQTIEYYTTSSWVQVGQQPFTDSTFPHGFVNYTDSVMSFNNGTRTFSIAPTSSQYVYYYGGVRRIKTGTDSVTIGNTSGSWWVYFDASDTLQASQTYPDLATSVTVATFYFNATYQVIFGINELRHGVSMDWATRKFFHDTFGPRLTYGFDLINYTLTGDGTANADAEIGLTNGGIAVEDLSFNVTNATTPSAFLQAILSPIAKMSTSYRLGNDWIGSAATDYPLKFGTSRVQYNKNTAGVWSLADATTDGNFVATWIITAGSYSGPMAVIIGQREDTTLADAKNNNTLEGLDVGNFTNTDIKFLYRLIFQTDSSYTNAVKAKLVDVMDVRNVSTAQVVLSGSGGTISHSSLSDLSNDDHLQYVHLANARTITAQHTFAPVTAQAPFVLDTNAQGQNVAGLNSDLLDGYHASDFQMLDADLSALANTSTTGVYVITGSGTSATRSIVGPAAGITVTNGSGVSGNPTLSLSNDLAAIEALTGSGFGARTATDTWAIRQLTAPASGFSITNNDGASGNPTFTLTDDLLALESLSTTGISVRTGASSWSTRTISGTANQISVSNGDGVAANPILSIASNPVLPGTQAVTVPSGTTAQQGTGSAGMLRFNTTTAVMEAHDGSNWLDLGKQGTVTSVALSSSDITIGGSPITTSGTITLTLNTVPISKGGTGQTTANDAFNALAPSQTGFSGRFLTTNGTDTSWATVTTGTVTSVAASGGTTGLSFTGSPITTSGTLTLTGTLAIANGGTGQTTASGAINALLPSQTGNSGRVLSTNGTAASWVVPNAGTVTSVGVSSSDITVSGSPITSSGTITLSLPTINANVGTFNNVTVNAKGQVTAASNVSYLTGNQTITLSGDVSGSGTTAITTTLATVNSNPGTFGSATQVPVFTVNGKGLITSVTNTSITYPVTSVAGKTGAVTLTASDVGLGSVSNSPQVINAGGAVSITEDTLANRPAAGTVGRIFFDTTNSVIQRDTGASWVTFGAPGTVTSVGATSPVASSGGSTPTISLLSGYGDTQNPYAAKTANFFLAAPNGASGVPTFRSMVAADVPTLNQNTTGQSGSVANAVTFNNSGSGGTSGSTFDGSSAVTISYNTVGASPLAGSSSLTTVGTITSGTWNGTTLAIANGGTGQTTATAAFNALSPITSTGDLIVGNGANSATRLAIGTANQVLTSTGTTAAWTAAKTIRQLITGSIAQATGTSTIPYDNTAPSSGEGTQIWSQSITPVSTSSVIQVTFAVMVDHGTAARGVTISVFRGTTLIDVHTNWNSASSFGQSIGPTTHSFDIIDSPSTTSPVTYSARVGGTGSGTWYVSRSAGATFGGETSQYCLKEIL